jgi:hypothetical protein
MKIVFLGQHLCKYIYKNSLGNASGIVMDIGPELRLVARTQSIEEASAIAERYELQGYETKIVKMSQVGIQLYEVWAGKKPDIIS